MRTPETQTAAQRAERLRTVPSNGQASSSQEPREVKPTNLDRARASLMSSPLASRPSASAHLSPGVEVDGSLSILSIDDLDLYDHNPRLGANPAYAQIRASMIANGPTSILTVTRRPGENKYFPHSGGNTRLAISKELAAAGDERFKQLRVMIKAWVSEALVIASHLGENENRGDTTFWEKAYGVHAYKTEFEKEFPGKTIIGAELNRELKKQGMDFGVRMIQNFLFAVDHLSPIGPWLRSGEVNHILRPKLSEYLDLMQRFGKTPAATATLKTYLEEAATAMREIEDRNRHREEAERTPTVLDAERVVVNIGEAFADLLNVPIEQLRRMSSALSNDPRLHSKDLLAVPEQAPVLASPSRPPASTGVSPDAVTAGAQSGLPAAHPQRAPGPAQRELGPLAGIVGGTDREGGAAHVPGQDGTAMSSSTDADAALTLGERRQRLFQEVEAVITSINSVVPIHDYVLRVPEMPFGYMVDIPVSTSQIGDVDVSASSGLRVVVWQFLAALSGQAHEQYWRQVANLPFIQATRWSQKMGEGLVPFAQHIISHLQVSCGPVNSEQTLFDLYVGGLSLWSVFSDERIGRLALRLVQLRRSIQDLEPEAHAALGMYLKFPG